MNCIHPPSLTLPRCRYMGSAWLSRAASWCYRSVATDQPVEKQKIRLLCNFFAIANSLLSLQSGNKPLCSRFCCIFCSQFVIGGLRAIPNRKKVAILVAFLFLVLGLLRNDVGAG